MKHRPSDRVLIATMAALLTIAACSGGDDASDTTAPPIATEAASGTTAMDTAPSTSFDVPQVTAETRPPTTTSSTSTSTTSSTEPPPTTEPIPIEDAVGAAVIASQDAYLYAVYNVDAQDALDRLRATSTGESLELGLENYQSIVDNGWLVRPNPDVPDRTTIASPVDVVDETSAEVTICNVGAGVVYAPGAADDGSDVIVNDLIEVSLLRVRMVLEDGTWKLASGRTIEELEGPSACDEF